MRAEVGYDGTIAFASKLTASLGLQFHKYVGSNAVIEPMISVIVTEPGKKSGSLTLGFRTSLFNSNYSNYYRQTQFFLKGAQVLFDAWVFDYEGEYALRSHTKPQRVDHFLGTQARATYRWSKRIETYLQVRLELNEADRFATRLVAGDDRFASYLKVVSLVGLTYYL